MTLGMLSAQDTIRLKEAGLDYYNHNIDTSERHYSKVITTRTFADRLETLARDLVPKGAAAGESPASGARATRDLQAGQIVLAEDIAQLRRIIVVKRDVEIGQSADSTLFETVERNLSEPADSLLSETSNLASFEFSRNIKSGEAVRRADLKPALLIRRGQSVAVTLATNSGLELTFRAEALHDARMGESVTLKNLESGKNIQGIVTGKGSARAL